MNGVIVIAANCLVHVKSYLPYPIWIGYMNVITGSFLLSKITSLHSHSHLPLDDLHLVDPLSNKVLFPSVPSSFSTISPSHPSFASSSPLLPSSYHSSLLLLAFSSFQLACISLFPALSGHSSSVLLWSIRPRPTQTQTQTQTLVHPSQYLSSSNNKHQDRTPTIQRFPLDPHVHMHTMRLNLA